MKRKLMISVVTMLFLLTLSALVTPLRANKATPNIVEERTSLNRDSLDYQIDGILSSGKMVFLYFYKEGCYACRLQKPLIDELEQEYSDDVVFIRVNGLEDRKAMAEFGVRGFPTMFLIFGKNADGYEYEDFEGYTEKSLLKTSIDSLVSPVVESVEPQESADLSQEMASETSVVETEPEDVVPPATTYTCKSCADCNAKLAAASPGDTVLLTVDINDHRGSCINIANTGVIFDGGGHLIDGDGVGDYEYGVGVIGRAKNRIVNCRITDFYYGIYLLDRADDTTIMYNEVVPEKYEAYPNQFGIYIEGCYRVLVAKNLVRYNKVLGIYVYGDGYNAIKDNLVVGNTEDGIYLYRSTYNIIEGNTVEKNGKRGIMLYWDSDNNIIRQNKVFSNTEEGIYLWAANDNTVEGNGVNYNYWGIYLHGSNRTTIEKNTVRYNAGGMLLFYSYENQVVDNIVNDNTGIGIYLYVNANNNNVTLNTVSYNNDGLYVYQASYNWITNNTVLHNDRDGIYVTECYWNYLWWNDFSFNGRRGIYLYLTTYFIWVYGSKVEHNQEQGIRIESCTYAYIDTSKVYSNYHGIVLVGDSDYNYIRYSNHIVNNVYYGVYFASTSNNCKLLENVICRNFVDIKDYDANSGDENTCNTPDGWNDDGTTGCTYSCPAGWCYDYDISEWINPPTTVDWNVVHKIECNDTEITLNGNLLISGELRFNHVKLMMNVTSMGEHEIEVRPGGAFYINSRGGFPSNITNGLYPDIYYTFTVEAGASAFEMRNSELHNCGHAWGLPNLNESGLWIAADNAIIENNLITNNFVGMLFYHSSNHRILGNTINSNGLHGIVGLNSHNNVIIGNEIGYNGKLPWPIGFAGDGILLNSTSNTIISYNTIIWNSKGDGIELWDAPNSDITHNTVERNSYHGIYLFGAPNSNITNNEVERNGYDGISLSWGEGSVVMHNLVNPNVGSRVGHNGIVVSSSTNTNLFNNTANWNNYHGISLSGSPFSNVTDNTANSNGYSGIQVSSSKNTRITNNTADSNGDNGISLSGSPDSTIADNTPDYNGECGIRVSASSGTPITRNIANYNKHGIYVEHSGYVEITNNTASFNRKTTRHSTGIYIYNSYLLLIETNVVNSNWRGIYLEYTYETSIIINTVSAHMSTLFGIHLYKSPFNQISDNNVDGIQGEYDSAGIYLSNSSVNTISLNEVKLSLNGIVLWESNHVTITENEATYNDVGISVLSSNWAEISYNNASYNFAGISLSSSHRNTIAFNRAVNNKYGISLHSSSRNGILGNDARFNYFGIRLIWSGPDNEVINNDAKLCIDYGAYLYRSNDNRLESNDFSSSNSTGIYVEHSKLNIILLNNAAYAINYGINLFESNTTLIGGNDVRFSGDIGIELSSSHHNTLLKNIAEGSDIGISIRFSTDNTIQENRVVGNDIGIYLLKSSYNGLITNNASNNNNVGIDLSMSDFNAIAGNTVNENPTYGIHLYSSKNNTLESNSVNLNGIGVYLDWSEKNTIAGNNVTNNGFVGIAVYWSSDYNRILFNQVHSNMNVSIRISSSNFNHVEGNNASLSGVGIFLDWSENNTIIGNTADSNAYHGIVLEWFSDNNEVADNSAKGGLVGISLDMSSFNTIANNNASLNKIGISVEWLSNNNTIIHNTMSHNQYHGLSIHWESNYNLIRNNVIGYNNKYGAYIYESFNNTIYHNDFLYNIDQAFDNAINAWDNGYPTGGNYWSDYMGVDLYSGPYQNETGPDGIGDTPYVIDADSQDNYPLMGPMSPVVITAFYVSPSSFSPGSFSPTAKSVFNKDTTIIRAMFTDQPDVQPIPTTSVEWILRVKRIETETVRYWRGMDGTVNVEWDGRDEAGEVLPDGEYIILLQGCDKDGNPTIIESRLVVIDTEPPTITDVSDSPDPFNPHIGQTSTINYTLSAKCYVMIMIYDAAGMLVQLLRATQPAGANSMTWDGTIGNQGLIVPDGTYTYEIHATDMAGNEATPATGTITVTS